jgi:hypothetical protein
MEMSNDPLYWVGLVIGIPVGLALSVLIRAAIDKLDRRYQAKMLHKWSERK